MVQLKHCCQQCLRLLSFRQIATGGILGCLCSTYKSGVAEFDLQKISFYKTDSFWKQFPRGLFQGLEEYKTDVHARHPLLLPSDNNSQARSPQNWFLDHCLRAMSGNFPCCILLSSSSCPNHSNSSHPDVVTSRSVYHIRWWNLTPAAKARDGSW